MNGVKSTDAFRARLIQSALVEFSQNQKGLSASAVNMGLMIQRSGIVSGVKTVGKLVNKNIGDIANMLNNTSQRVINKQGEKQLKQSVIIIDDFERVADEAMTQILGEISVELLETFEARVIIIANESQILTTKEDNHFSKVKEKVIGRTVEFRLDYKLLRRDLINKYAPSLQDGNDVTLLESVLTHYLKVKDNDINLRTVTFTLTIIDELYSQLPVIDAHLKKRAMEEMFYTVLLLSGMSALGIITSENMNLIPRHSMFFVDDTSTETEKKDRSVS